MPVRTDPLDRSGRASAPASRVSQRSTWSASGAAWLTGHADGPPLGGPDALVDLVAATHRRLVDAVGAWQGPGVRDGQAALAVIDPMALLGERAALGGLQRQGRTSCGGSTRLYEAADGWMAVALPRASDLELVPAWLGAELTGWSCDPTELDVGRLGEAIRARSCTELAARAALVGLAAGAIGEVGRDVAPARDGHLAHRSSRVRPAVGGRHRRERPLVVDLAALWAGPLCSHLLAAAGADVVKVESVRRPDGMRSDRTGLFDLLTAGKRSVAVDFTTGEGREQLGALLRAADIVVEGSRPRALRQLGIDPDELVAGGGPTVWVSITAHGRTGDAAARIGFGDDAAVAGGLVAWDRSERPCFLADAVADPLTGLVAAAAAAEAWASGGNWLVDVALARVAASAAVGTAHPAPELDEAEVARPRARPITGVAPQLGEHTAAVLAEVAG